MRIRSSSAISENSIVFFEGGHNHDGISSSLIDGEKYSIYDFTVGLSGSSGRQARQRANFNNLKTVISNVVINDVLGPAGIRLLPNSIQSIHIQAGAITANELSANIILVDNIIRSNNYVSGSSGWIINGNGVAEFDAASIRGTLTAAAVSTPGVDIFANGVLQASNFVIQANGAFGNNNFGVDASGNLTAANANITGSLVITGGSTLTSIQNAQSAANNAQSDADSAFNLASTKITAGEVVTTINGGSTTISGDKIETGTLNADRISGGTITASIAMNAAAINGGSINIATNFVVDGAGAVFGRNITIDSGFRYRCEGIFNSTSSTTTARVHNPGGQEALCSPSSKREYKYNIEDIPDALSILETVRPRIFNWKLDVFDQLDPWTNEPWTDQAKALNEFNKSYGFIAEEMEEDQPFLTVYEAPDRTLPMDQPGGIFDLAAWEPKMWKEMDFIPLLVKAVQELSAKVEALESYLFNGPNNEV